MSSGWRPAIVVCWVGGLSLLAFVFTLLDAFWWRGADNAHLESNRSLVRRLLLTDLALFTEARYTRHVSQADRHTPFQDHPVALEHFPSASWVLPPSHLISRPEESDLSHARTLD